MHQNRQIPPEDTMNIHDELDSGDDILEDVMDARNDGGDEDEDAESYQGNDDESEGEGGEDSSDEDLGPEDGEVEMMDWE